MTGGTSAVGRALVAGGDDDEERRSPRLRVGEFGRNPDRLDQSQQRTGYQDDHQSWQDLPGDHREAGLGDLTLMIQDIIAEPEWENVLTDADQRGLTPLFHTNMTPYGDISLHMRQRIALSTPAQPDNPNPSHDAGHAELHVTLWGVPYRHPVLAAQTSDGTWAYPSF